MISFFIIFSLGMFVKLILEEIFYASSSTSLFDSGGMVEPQKGEVSKGVPN